MTTATDQRCGIPGGWDVLDMFRVIGASMDRLSVDELAALGDDAEYRLRFGGFDLNDSREGRLLDYVRYLVGRDRWTEIKQRLAEVGDDGNSHSPRLGAMSAYWAFTCLSITTA